MPGFVRVADAAELAPGSGKEIVVGGQSLALFNMDGRFHAIGNRCAHRGGPLGQGTLVGQVVMCPLHAFAFDVTTGISPDDPQLRVPSYEVEVSDGGVFVKLE